MDISCGFAPGPRAAEQAALAERLGFRRAWFYDSPALYGDVWMALAQAASATSTIGLGTAVLVPDLRHVLVTASAIATLEAIAPGRAVIAVGTGFTGRLVLGRRPLPWTEVEGWLRALRALLRGERVEVDGGLVQMIHPRGLVADRPVTTPIVVAANGPKGLRVARELGDGVMCVGAPQPGFDHCALLAFGTVLDDGEELGTPRVLEAAGPGAAVVYHGIYEGSPEAVDNLPGGAEWRHRLEADEPPASRHLALHRGHFFEVDERDRALLDDPSIVGFTWTGTPEQVRARIGAAADGGCTELVYAPMGPDIERELRAFMAAATG